MWYKVLFKHSGIFKKCLASWASLVGPEKFLKRPQITKSSKIQKTTLKLPVNTHAQL